MAAVHSAAAGSAATSARAGRGSFSYSPFSSPPSLLWGWRADQGVTITASPDVDSWRGAVSNKTLIGGAVNKPHFVAADAAIDDNPTIDIGLVASNVQFEMYGDPDVQTAFGGAFTVALVLPNGGTSPNRLISFGAGLTPTTYGEIYISSAGIGLRYLMQNGAGNTILSFGSTFPTTKAYVVAAYNGAGAMRFFVNGTFSSPTPGTHRALTSLTHMELGNSLPSAGAAASIAECLVSTAQWADSDITSWYNYCLARYGAL